MARKVKRLSVAVWILAILLRGTFLASYAMLLSVFLLLYAHAEGKV